MDSDLILKEIRGSKLGAEFEVRVEEESVSNLSIERGKFIGGENKENRVASIRCLCKGRLSTVGGSLRSLDQIKDFLTIAYKLAKSAGSTDTQSTFAREDPPRGPNPFSKKILSNELQDIAKKMMSAVGRLEKASGIHSVNGQFASSVSKLYGANSFGINCEWKGTYAYCSSNVIANDGIEHASAEEDNEALDQTGLDFEATAERAAELARNMLGAKQAPTFKGQLLIDPKAACQIVGSFVGAMSGEEVLKHRSFLTNRKNTEIASKKVVLREEKSFKGSPFNRSFDDEFMPTTSKFLIKDGQLKTYLHNLYSSEKMRESDTGNGFACIGGFVDTTNVVMSPGKGAVEDFIPGMDRGAYLIDTGDSPNESTGDLSAMILNGYYIENGKMVHPLKETMIGINMIDLMKKISAIGKDLAKSEGMVIPSILVDDVQISGK